MDKRFTVPKGDHSLFRRSSFLKGKLKTFFGPRQSETCIYEYKNPEDWPPEGYVLRAPQVVWLSCESYAHDQDTFNLHFAEVVEPIRSVTNIGSLGYYINCDTHIAFSTSNPYYTLHNWMSGTSYSNGTYQYDYQDDGEGTYHFEHDVLGNVVTVIDEPAPIHHVSTEVEIKDGRDGRPWYYDSTITNTMKATYDLMYQSVFPAVKAKIEELRKGKTWVEIKNWQAGFNDANWNIGADFFPLFAFVPIGQEKYFGVNFMHIWVGMPTTSYNSTWTPDIPYNYESDLYTAQQKFFGYRVDCYSIDTEPDQHADFPDFPFSVVLPPVPSIKYVSRDDSYTTFGPSTWTWGLEYHPDYDISTKTAEEMWINQYDTQEPDFTLIHDDLKLGAKENQDTIDRVNKSFRDDVTNMQDVLQQWCSTYAQYGFTYKGNGASLDVDTIVQSIAEAFHFNPETGEDLPM